MTVYVDELKHWPNARIPGWWCHLAADTHDELMEFAQGIGLNPRWIQSEGRPLEHFDLRGKRMRDKAIAAGATPVTSRELGRIGSAKVDAVLAQRGAA